MKKVITNPNKVNQYTDPDPRQALFIEYYFDRESDTFANALKSAVKAGFTEEYGKVLTSNMPKWLSETIKDSSIIKKAERNLNNFLDDDKNLTIKADMTKFALKGLKKDKYSERTEHTGKDGKDLNIKVVNYGDNTASIPAKKVSDTNSKS